MKYGVLPIEAILEFFLHFPIDFSVKKKVNLGDG